MASGTIKNPVEYTNDSAAITTTHTLKAARTARIGRIYIANITVDLTSNITAWTRILTLNNVTIPESQYIYGNINGESSAMFYVGRAGEVSCTTALQNTNEIKIAITLVTN